MTDIQWQKDKGQKDIQWQKDTGQTIIYKTLNINQQ